MISQNPTVQSTDDEQSVPPKYVALVRYGVVPQVARFSVSEELHQDCDDQLTHSTQVVINSDRGSEIGQFLEFIRMSTAADGNPVTGDVVRIASAGDLEQHADNRRRSDSEFFDWQQRITEWQLQLQLVDTEWTLDGEQIVLYVLNGQDAETTRLALLAAAAGLGIIHVQPVAAEGMLQKPSGGGGGCGSGGCGSGGCGS